MDPLETLKTRVMQDYRRAKKELNTVEARHLLMPGEHTLAKKFELTGMMDECNLVISYIEELQGDVELPLSGGKRE